MKQLFLFYTVMLMSFGACKQATDSTTTAAPFDEAKEKIAIVQTIEEETARFYARDYAGWSNYFAQTDYAFQGWNNPDGTFGASVGWKDLDAKTDQYMKANPVPPGGSSHPKVERKNMIFKFYGENAAFLTWDQYNMDENLKNYYHSRESRIMEKIDGKWKIVNVSAFWDYKNLIPVDSLEL